MRIVEHLELAAGYCGDVDTSGLVDEHIFKFVVGKQRVAVVVEQMDSSETPDLVNPLASSVATVQNIC